MDSPDELLSRIGSRVSQRRGALGLTLDEVAERTGVSRAMVSRIERGEVHASAVVLDRLCAGLGIELSELFAREGPSPLLRRADQPVWRDPTSGYLRRELAQTRPGSPVRMVEIEFPPGAVVAFEPSPDRLSEQHVWLLDGQLEVTTGGSVYALAAGDCLRMRVADGNSFRNRGPEPARYLVVIVRGALK